MRATFCRAVGGPGSLAAAGVFERRFQRIQLGQQRRVLIGAAVWHVLASAKDQLLSAPLWEPPLLLDRAVRETVRVLIAVLTAQGLVAALDVFWVRLRHARQLRMSRE